MVGRIVYLKNYHIPPMDTEIKGEYLAYGYYDAIQIGKNLFANESGAERDLAKMWKQSVEDAWKQEKGCSLHTLYLFRDVDEEEDQRFWDKKEFPFLFLVMLQLQGKNKYLKNTCKVLEEKIQCFFDSKIFQKENAKKLQVEIHSYCLL